MILLKNTQCFVTGMSTIHLRKKRNSLHIRKGISYSLSLFCYFYPRATSSDIITVNPTAKKIVPRSECSPWDISGISSSTTTYSMAPAKRSRTFVHLVPSCGFNALLRYCRGLCPVAFAKRVEKLLASPKPTFCAISPTLWSVRTSSSFACVMRKLTR